MTRLSHSEVGSVGHPKPLKMHDFQSRLLGNVDCISIFKLTIVRWFKPNHQCERLVSNFIPEKFKKFEFSIFNKFVKLHDSCSMSQTRVVYRGKRGWVSWVQLNAGLQIITRCFNLFPMPSCGQYFLTRVLHLH